MVSAEAQNLEAISKAIDHHNETCEYPAIAVEMNPFEVERLGWDTIRGLPIRPEPALGTGSFRVVCAREEGEPGEETEAVAGTDEPLEVPETVPAEAEPEKVPVGPGRIS